LRDADGRPVMRDPSRPYGLSETAEPFVAGILHHLPALAALTAPSIVSYFRLRPNRWAPVWANLAERDRGASLRVCAVIAAAAEDEAHQFNVEYRVSDATASPYMALGAIVHAGVDGIRQGMKLGAPPPKTIWEMTEEQRRELGIATLPGSLAQALVLLEASETVRGWLGPQFSDAYIRLRRSEIAAVRDQSDEAMCARYAAAYCRCDHRCSPAPKHRHSSDGLTTLSVHLLCRRPRTVPNNREAFRGLEIGSYREHGTWLALPRILLRIWPAKGRSLCPIGLCTGSNLGGIEFVDVVDQLVGHGILGIQLLVDDLLLEQPIVVRLIV